MKKKNKLKLNDLKVQSFVTNLKKEDKEELKGGATVKILCDGGISQYHSFCDTCQFVCD